MTEMAPYDSAEFLRDPEAILHYIEEALKSGDKDLLMYAMEVIVRAWRIR
jgi:DNA-binding phage protein